MNIRASLNRGLTPVLKEAFPLTIPTFVDKSMRKIPAIPHGDWVAGFTTGEGHFSVYIGKPRGKKLNVSVEISFVLTQHTRDKQLMESLVKFFGFTTWGNYYLRSSEEGCDYKCTNLLDNYEKIIPFFKEYKIRGAKLQEFQDWCQIVELVKNKAHLTSEGHEEIKQIKSRMNRQRQSSVEL